MTLSTGRHFGLSLNASGVLQNWCRWSSSSMTAWLARSSPMAMWRMLPWSARHEAGLRTSPDPHQRPFHLYAVLCCPRSGEGGLHSLLPGRLPLRPALNHSKDDEPANSPPRGSFCWRLRTSVPRRTRPRVDAGPLLLGIQALPPDNQSWKAGGAPPTSTILPPTITIDDKPLANVEHFKYLGSTISCDISFDREIDTRQVRRWAVSAIECSVKTTSTDLRNWRSTMPWFFPPSSMVVRRVQCIAGISRNWSSSTC